MSSRISRWESGDDCCSCAADASVGQSGRAGVSPNRRSRFPFSFEESASRSPSSRVGCVHPATSTTGNKQTGARGSDSLVIRVRTLYASTAASTATYYTRYLTDAPEELPGQWAGQQADLLDLNGTVTTEALERCCPGGTRSSSVRRPVGRMTRSCTHIWSIRARCKRRTVAGWRWTPAC